jgi:hypothetical protein
VAIVRENRLATALITREISLVADQIANQRVDRAQTVAHEPLAPGMFARWLSCLPATTSETHDLGRRPAFISTICWIRSAILPVAPVHSTGMRAVKSPF